MDKIKVKLLCCVLLIPILSYGQEFVSVCDRTPQVRDAIMEVVHEIDESIECSDDEVLSLILSEITALSDPFNRRLESKEITSLKVGDFSGFTSLKVLYLNGNRLTALPQSIFSGLTSLKWASSLWEPISIFTSRCLLWTDFFRNTLPWRQQTHFFTTRCLL